MINKTPKKERVRKRHRRIRNKVFGTKERPRLSIYKSNKHVYAQLIDDTLAHTLLFCSTNQPNIRKGLGKTWTREAAKKLGETVAKEALDKGIKKVVFDRGGNRYHGKVLAIAEGVRACGLEF